MDPVTDFLVYVLKGLVDNPDAVKVERTVDEMGVLMTVDVDPIDMGKIIGRRGATAKAIRTILRVVGMKQNQRVNMKINEPEGGTGFRQDNEMPQAAPAADVDAAIADLKDDMGSAI